MTTTASPGRGPTGARTPRVLLVASGCVAASVVIATVLGAVIAGGPAALGALLGGAIALGFFAFGSLVVAAATKMAPEASLLVALMTYTLQVVLVAGVFVAIGASGVVGDEISGGWLAGGVVAATVAWTVGQLVASSRARIPVYDVDLPDSRAREAGAP